MNPEQIKEIQARLQAKGLYTGAVDGKMGPATQRAMVLEQQMTPKKSDAEINLELAKPHQNASEDAGHRRAVRGRAADPLSDAVVPFGAGALVGGIDGEVESEGLDKRGRGNVHALKEGGDGIGATRGLTPWQANGA